MRFLFLLTIPMIVVLADLCQADTAVPEVSAYRFALLELEEARMQCDEIYMSGKDYLLSTSGPCLAVTVMCIPDREWGITDPYALCIRDRCRLIMRESTCKALGLKHGQIWDPGQLLERLKHGVPRSYDEVINICLTLHELRHSQDPLDLLSNCSEENAYRESLKCLEEYYASLCGTPPSISQSDCKLLDLEICGEKGAIDYNSCLCKEIKANPAVGREACVRCRTGCESTVASCLPSSSPLTAAAICQVWHEMYCKQTSFSSSSSSSSSSVNSSSSAQSSSVGSASTNPNEHNSTIDIAVE